MEMILIITVNYNNSILTLELSENIDKLFSHYDFFIVDNNSDDFNKSLLKNVRNGKVIFNPHNVGYFQGINIVLNDIQIELYDKIIICNNDILFDNKFYNILKDKKYDDNIYAISPRIYDINGKDQNPMLDKGISRLKIFFYDLHYKNYYFGMFMYKLYQVIKRIIEKPKVSDFSRKIFMGYGAIYILTKYFFNKNKLLLHPPFLMGEETFIANQIYKTGGILFYDKDLIVHHKDHSSCSKIPSKKMYNITKESYKEYRELMLRLPHL
jgi:GT2 family glycosyltransferase